MSSEKQAAGASRNLTEVFLLLRNNAQQNKFMYENSSYGNASKEFVHEERMSLVDLEDGSGHMGDGSTQPLWIHTSDEIEFEFERIRSRLDELDTIQRKHLSRPNFGDESFEAEEKQMEAMTEQITTMMSHSQRLINMMSTQGSLRESKSEKKLRDNAVSALVFTLSELANSFRTRQSKYLGRIRNRTSHLDNFLVTSGHTDDVTWGELVDVTPTKEYSMVQLQEIMMNEQEVREREKEVLAVNSSIRDLNHLFKDLSSMIVDQGTILDRIDYNVEVASVRVNKAVSSVEKAERYQRADKKMHCICLLATAIMMVLLLIILKKSI